MTKFQPVTVKSIRKIFLWTLLLCPVLLFVLILVISLFADGYSGAFNKIRDVVQKHDILHITGYFIALALMFTLIVVSSTLYYNYKWKKFFTSDAINAIKKYGFTFSHEGLDGVYKGINVAIRYYKWKDTELAYILLKTQSALHAYSEVENHDFGNDCTLTNMGNVFQIEINIKGSRRKKELDFQKLFDKSIKFAGPVS